MIKLSWSWLFRTIGGGDSNEDEIMAFKDEINHFKDIWLGSLQLEVNSLNAIRWVLSRRCFSTSMDIGDS